MPISNMSSTSMSRRQSACFLKHTAARSDPASGPGLLDQNRLLTLRWRRPAPGSVFAGCCPARCSQTPAGRRSGPGRRRPCRRSSWTRSSGCRCSGGKSTSVSEKQLWKRPSGPEDNHCGRRDAGWRVRVPGAVWRTYLVADGLGAAPVQQDLLDPAGAGHPEALGALQFGLGLSGSVGQKDDGASNTSSTRGHAGGAAPTWRAPCSSSRTWPSWPGPRWGGAAPA